MSLILNYDLDPKVEGQVTLKSKPHVNKSNTKGDMIVRGGGLVLYKTYCMADRGGGLADGSSI